MRNQHKNRKDIMRSRVIFQNFHGQKFLEEENVRLNLLGNNLKYKIALEKQYKLFIIFLIS